ncbi:uncharacterized protein LOC121370637 [Gigantopelta aegis]|uniref:uncharacterized protein LOC121370637 n=1 Tax=Gigantopelta aegis TaxID=1735272 RepID=UPI001B88C671|nr:uncharacterized protein LOC121370637 [Gigantopelta aegis]
MNRLYHPPVTPRPANLDRGTWGRKYTDVSVRGSVMSVKILVLGIFFIGIFMLTIALIMGLEFPKYVRRKIIEDQCIINANHPKYDTWRLGDLWTRKNRIYYLVIENESGFLFNGEVPKIKERGPYVYTEVEVKDHVVFNVHEVYYTVRRIHSFDVELTAAECGNNCTENEQLTLVNPEFLKQTTYAGGEQLFVISQMPAVVSKSLTFMGINVHGPDTRTIEVVGCLNSICDNHWSSSSSLSMNSDLNWLSFGLWLRLNDTAYKTVILTDRQGASFSQTQMLGLFDVLLQRQLLHGGLLFSEQERCQKWSQYVACASTDSFSWQSASFTDYETKCGIVPLLQEYRKRGTSCLANLTTVLNTFLCKEDTRCFNITGDSELSSAYVRSIADFVLNHLGVFVHNKIFLKDRGGLVTTRNQSDFALGYYIENDSLTPVFVHGVLSDHWTGASGLDNPVWKMATCLENRNIDNNMAVRGFNGSQFAPQTLLRNPHSYAYVSGHSNYASTCGKLKACAACRVPDIHLPMFVPELWRSVTFSSAGESVLFGTTQYRYFLSNDTFFSDGAYLVDNGLQNITGLYGYLSWRSNPLFYGASSLYFDGHFNNSVRTRHLSFVDVEAHTGRMWQKRFRFQFNVGVTAANTDAPKSRPLNVTYLGQPIPVYWLERSIVITNDEVDYFNYKVTRLMRVACGGLVGMTVVAFIVMIISVVVCIYSTKTNRVDPVPEEPSQTQNHR